MRHAKVVLSAQTPIMVAWRNMRVLRSDLIVWVAVTCSVIDFIYSRDL